MEIRVFLQIYQSLCTTKPSRQCFGKNDIKWMEVIKIKELIESIIPKLKFKFPYSAEEYAENLYVENYHKHTSHSNLSSPDSAESIENYVKRSLEYNNKCLFSGEHGNQGNVFLTYKEAEKSKLKYRHSVEAYWVKDRLEKDKSNCHIVLVAKNDEGRKDINFIISEANTTGYYYKPRIDLELLLSVPRENIIVTSACVAGWKYEDAEDIWFKIHEHFGDNFFLEVQTHNTDPQKKLNKRIIDMINRYRIQIICGLDSHYAYEENSIKRDQILKYKKVFYDDEDGWYLDFPNGKEIFRRLSEQGVLTEEEILTSMMNTCVFIDECSDMVFDKHFKIPCVYPNTTYEERVQILKDIINERYKKEELKSKEKIEGIQYEVEQIVDSGVVDYFLTNDKIIYEAVNNFEGILTTTSRGSAASFIINKLLGFTTIDRFSSEVPIFPERFLTKDRVLSGQMPDVDLNLAVQEPFVLASKKLLGEHGCYPLLAIEKLKEKAAWQLYAGANDIKPEIANQVSKFIEQYNEKLKYAEDEDKRHIHVEDFIPEEYLDIYKESLDYQGITINGKAHACGHLLLDGDIRREIGLIRMTSESTGNSVLCANIEGTYLDEFGYVKNDYLIVDSVHLTHKFFESIEENVPSFDQLRKMIENDKKTWEIYEKGITCCVNQVEKESTTKKVMRYKPKTLEELSAFIAAIRPGFKSLLNTFINREDYTTGESAIDEILKDSYHFMLYQESLMRILSYLGIPMVVSYETIKKISKKKFKDGELEKLQNTMTENWMKIINNLDNFEKVWQVFSDSARYGFNAPHALSMGGDSAYQAWFKAHHTTKFYEVAINHYQDKGKKDKIDALVKEAMIHYGFKLGNYEFGKDNRRVNIDEENKIIYPNLSSIKGFGEGVAQELFDIGKKEYCSFIELLDELKTTKINRTVLDKLIRLGYFKPFGTTKHLQEIVNLYDLISEAKSLSKEKILSNNLDIEIVKQYGKETDKQISKLNSRELLARLIENIKPEQISIKEIIDNQKDILGIITYQNDNISRKMFYVEEIEIGSSLTKTKLYRISNGETHELKIWTKKFNKNSFAENDVLYVENVEKKPQRIPTGEIDLETGKKIYEDSIDRFEFWLNEYYVVTNDFKKVTEESVLS